jgi:Kef-type K+ transport system membrane component KefB
MLEVLLNIPESLLFDLGLIFIFAALFAFIARVLRQPLIPAYIIAGLILGPIGFRIISEVEVINHISELGIMFLLFLVGLEMELKKFKKLGVVTIITALFQVGLTFLAGYFVGLFLGFETINAVYAGMIVAFSSTMIVIKLLFDKKELNTLHGRIILGILFMQDIFVIVALTILTGTSTFSTSSIIPIIAKFLILVSLAYIINVFIAHKVFKIGAQSRELLVLMSVGILFLFALLAYSFGFSVAIGAFLAGVTLANLPYSKSLVARISSLKDFFATIFFVSLGLQLTLPQFSLIIKPLIILLLLVLILKPLIIMTILSVLGYDKRNTFASAISLAQISEFGLILALSVDNMSPELFSITILLGIITITLTSYIIKYDLQIYTAFSKPLSIFEKLSRKKRKIGHEFQAHKKVILFGCNRMGQVFLKSMIKKVKKSVLVIDFNPNILEKLQKRKIASMYGDMSNPEVLDDINFKYAKVVISTVPRVDDNLALLKHLKGIKSKSLKFVTANTLDESFILYDAGADYVIIPSIMSGERVAYFLDKYTENRKGLNKIKRDHLKHLLELKAES